MEHSPEINERMTDAALEYLRLGYRPIPLPPGSKGKGMRLKWKMYQSRPPSAEEIRHWFSQGEPNVAFVTGDGLVVVDCDSPEMVKRVIEHCGDTPMRCATPTPGHQHLYFRMRGGVHYGNAVKIKDQPIDLRCEGGLVVAPWSRNERGIAYRWAGPVLPVSELPVLRVGWLREHRPRRVVTPAEVSGTIEQMMRRARAYVARIEGAIAGQRGHDRTFRVACVLVLKFGLDFTQAWPLLKEWSETSCEPPWNDRELEHKLLDALKKRQS